MIKNIWNWFVRSSADPKEFALTLKAGLPLLALLGLGSITEDANTLIEGLANLLVVTGQLIAGVLTTWGLVRKIYITIRNTLFV